MSEVGLGDLNERNAKLTECNCHTAGVGHRRLNPQIEVLGKAWLGSADDGVAADHQITDPMLCEAL